MSLIREALEKARREPPAPATSETFRSAPLIHRSSRAPWLLGGAILAVALLATALGAYWLGRNAPGEQGAQEGAQEGATRFSATGGTKAQTAEGEERPAKEGPAPEGSSQDGAQGEEGASRSSPGPAADAAREGASRFSPSPEGAPEGASRFSPGLSPIAVGAGASPPPEAAPLPPRTTTPAAPPQTDDPGLRLEGIVGSASDPVAVINGSLVGVGDLVVGYRVLRIHGDRVEVGRDGRTVVLKLR